MNYHDLSFYCGLFLIRVGPLLKESVFTSLFLPLCLGHKSDNFLNFFQISLHKIEVVVSSG
jgi:hypothetical protein